MDDPCYVEGSRSDESWASERSEVSTPRSSVHKRQRNLFRMASSPMQDSLAPSLIDTLDDVSTATEEHWSESSFSFPQMPCLGSPITATTSSTQSPPFVFSPPREDWWECLKRMVQAAERDAIVEESSLQVRQAEHNARSMKELLEEQWKRTIQPTLWEDDEDTTTRDSMEDDSSLASSESLEEEHSMTCIERLQEDMEDVTGSVDTDSNAALQDEDALVEASTLQASVAEQTATEMEETLEWWQAKEATSEEVLDEAATSTSSNGSHHTHHDGTHLFPESIITSIDTMDDASTASEIRTRKTTEINSPTGNIVENNPPHLGELNLMAEVTREEASVMEARLVAQEQASAVNIIWSKTMHMADQVALLTDTPDLVFDAATSVMDDEHLHTSTPLARAATTEIQCPDNGLLDENSAFWEDMNVQMDGLMAEIVGEGANLMEVRLVAQEQASAVNIIWSKTMHMADEVALLTDTPDLVFDAATSVMDEEHLHTSTPHFRRATAEIECPDNSLLDKSSTYWEEMNAQMDGLMAEIEGEGANVMEARLVAQEQASAVNVICSQIMHMADVAAQLTDTPDLVFDATTLATRSHCHDDWMDCSRCAELACLILRGWFHQWLRSCFPPWALELWFCFVNRTSKRTRRLILLSGAVLLLVLAVSAVRSFAHIYWELMNYNSVHGGLGPELLGYKEKHSDMR